jgi:hypothetical protein
MSLACRKAQADGNEKKCHAVAPICEGCLDVLDYLRGAHEQYPQVKAAYDATLARVRAEREAEQSKYGAFGLSLSGPTVRSWDDRNDRAYNGRVREVQSLKCARQYPRLQLFARRFP